MRTQAVLVRPTLVALLLVGFCLLANGQTTVDAIKARLVGKPLLLRGFWLDDDLRFDSAGKPVAVYKTGSFTESGFDATEVKLDGDQLTLTGRRVGLLFNEHGAERILMRKPKMFTGTPEQITIEIDGHGNPDFSQELNAVFASSVFELIPFLPKCWQPFARRSFVPPGSRKKHPDDLILPAGPDGAMAHSARAPALPPAKFGETSQAADAAGKGNFSGTVELYLWLGADGNPTSITIVRPIGLGYDEKAVDAVAHYHFKPAMFGTRPVATDIYLTVNFQIL